MIESGELSNCLRFVQLNSKLFKWINASKISKWWRSPCRLLYFKLSTMVSVNKIPFSPLVRRSLTSLDVSSGLFWSLTNSTHLIHDGKLTNDKISISSHIATLGSILDSQPS